MLDKSIIKEQFFTGFKELGEFLVKKTVDELEGQGHRATGKLIDSVEAEVFGSLTQLNIVLKHFQYGVYVEYGVKAERVPFSGFTGNKVSKYIQALIRWVIIKRFTGSLTEAKGIAFAIARTHKKEGIPSRNSYNFASNGRRKFFMREVKSRNEKKVIKDVEGLSLEIIQNALFQAIDKL
jgi:hypothetical protein